MEYRNHGPFLSEVTRIRSVFEKIQDHHKSSIYALKTMRGEDIPSRAKERYLDEKARRREYLGTVMLKVNNTKPKAQLLQSLMDRYDCNRLTNLDDKTFLILGKIMGHFKKKCPDQLLLNFNKLEDYLTIIGNKLWRNWDWR